MRRASVYRRKGLLFFHSSSKTTEWIWIATPPFLMEPEYSEKALEASETDVPHPVRWENHFKPFLEVVGVRSWETLSRTSQYCEVEDTEVGIEFIPHRNLGPAEGYDPLNSKRVH